MIPRLASLWAFALLFAPPALAHATGVAPAQEQVPGGRLMLYGYLLFWAFPLILLWFTSRRVARLEREATELRRLIAQATQG